MRFLNDFSTIALLIIATVLSFGAHAKLISSSVISDNEVTARNEVLVELAQQVFVEVKVSSNSYESTHKGSYFEEKASINTNLPLYDVAIDCLRETVGISCTASVDAKELAKMYQEELVVIYDNIYGLAKKERRLPRRKSYATLQEIISEIKKHQAMSVVVIKFLRGVEIKRIPMSTLRKYQSKLEKYMQSISNPKTAAKIIAQELYSRNIFLKELVEMKSQSETEFSVEMRTWLSRELKSVRDEDDADYILSGSYEYDIRGIYLLFETRDKTGELLKTDYITLPKAVVGSNDYREPKTDWSGVEKGAEVVVDGLLWVLTFAAMNAR